MGQQGHSGYWQVEQDQAWVGGASLENPRGLTMGARVIYRSAWRRGMGVRLLHGQTASLAAPGHALSELFLPVAFASLKPFLPEALGVPHHTGRREHLKT